ncbi:MAG: site-specific integrase [Ferruginibacter sp.]|nr:site-specific integrase [Ferruginibacter sp.]
MLSLKTYLRTSRKDKKGESIIYFIVANDWISTGLKVSATFWDASNGIILKPHPKYYQLAPELQLIKSRAEQCLANYRISNNHFNRSYFETFVFSGSEVADNPCFLKLMDEYCSIKNLSWDRVKHYNQLKNQISEIFPRPKVKDITATFCDKLMKHLRAKNNNENTVIRKIKQLKAVIHFAEQKGILKGDPLTAVKLKQIKGNKQFLTLEELQTLETFYSSTLHTSYKNVLHYFLFSCYTALRFSDVQKLTYSGIKNDAVFTVQEKTGKPVMVPLCTQAKDLLQVNNIGKVFTVYQNQPTNRTLKDIMKAAGIQKKITYHCSRHTFATLSITFGIPMEVVADLMGVDDATVRVYAQIVNDLKKQEMLKWERKAV